MKIPEKSVGRRNECCDGPLFPPERWQIRTKLAPCKKNFQSKASDIAS